ECSRRVPARHHRHHAGLEGGRRPARRDRDPVGTAMDLSRNPGIQGWPSGVDAENQSSSGDVERQKIKQLAQEFEALLMTQMLREMRRTTMFDDENRGFGSETMTDTVDVELGSALSRAGGFGLADVLLRAFDRRDHGAPVPPTADDLKTAPAAERDVVAPAMPEAAPEIAKADAGPAPSSESAALPGHITSPFGWGSDPFTGKAR